MSIFYGFALILLLAVEFELSPLQNNMPTATARIVFGAAAISISSIVGIDPITKDWLGATALVSLFASIGTLSGETLALKYSQWELVFQ